MENNFKQFIDNAQNPLILLPKSPFFDQVAAGLALYLSLKDTKNVSIISDSEMTVEFNRLIGVDKISQESGNKNLVIKFKNYEAQNIERVAYDIEDGEFRLSVIPKPEVTPPAENQVEVNYTGLSADAVILVGGGNESHFPTLSKPELAKSKKAHVGLGALNLNNKDIINFADTAASTTEVMYRLLKQLGVTINADVASNLLAGLHEGSKNFSTDYVTQDTFQVAAELMSLGGSYSSQKPEKTYTAKDFGQTEPKEASPIANLDDVDSEEEVEKVTTAPAEQSNTPKSWLEPKIYKGTTAGN